jgi:hypothetical protein
MLVPDAALSPECRLVFLAVNADGYDDVVGGIARGSLDWRRVVAIAERENAVAGVWRSLERAAHNAIPGDIAEHLRRSRMVSDFRMLHLEQRLQATIGAFREHNVPVVLLKGAALGVSVYPSFADRPMVDADLLVRQTDIARAREAILASGWRASMNPALESVYAEHHHLAPFFDEQSTGLRVELHTAIMPTDHPFRLSDDDVWRDATPAPAAYGGALLPSASHLLYHACAHFAWSHTMQFGAWRTFRDTAELLRASRIDWPAFVRLVRVTRGASACYWTLRLARHMSGVRVPEHVLAALRAPSPEWVRRALERHFVANIALGEGPPCPSVRLSYQLWRMAIRPGWSGHGERGRWATTRTWALARTGAAPEAATTRVMRQIGGIRMWWNYMVRTLVPR